MVKWKYYKLRANRSGLNIVLPLSTCMTLDKTLDFSESQEMGWILEATSEPQLF